MLEAYIGVRLFRRDRHGITLTPAGEEYRRNVGPALASIIEATERLREKERSGALRLQVYATFAVKWLLPRFPNFQAAHADIAMQLNTTVKPVDFRT